jgi:outer membrane receptor protein involved in Fe transport
MLLLMRRLLLLGAVALMPAYFFAQRITGKVVDASGGDPIVGARVEGSGGEKALTNFDGEFVLEAASLPVTLVTTYVGYTPDTLVVKTPGNYRIKLVSSDKMLKTVVVSAGRRAQEIEEVPISMEIIRPDLIDSKGFTDLEQVVDQTPGVYAMDGQVSIRGGSGYAYGVGSRVMLLWNGMPLLTGDVGDIKFNAIPMENASQIEVLKGASSVLYGSGALNGVVSLTERDPSPDGEVRVKLQGGIYDNPRRESLRWWSRNPMLGMAEAFYGKMHDRVGYTIAINGFTTEGYRQGETENRARISGTLLYRPKKLSNLRAGLGYNVQWQKTGLYIIWENDSLAYQPSGGADPFDTNSNSTLIVNRGLRINVDPYVKYIDKKGNTHNLRTRIYWIDNVALTNTDQSNGSTTYFTDYQFQNKNKVNGILTTGISNSYVQVRANLFGQNTSFNPALYLQYEQKLWEKLTLVGGLRAEYFEQNGRRGDSDFSLGNMTLPVYPILRAAANYNLFKATFLRASFGQGVRYPSVAERYTFTNVGALNIFPNPDLKRETGWASEIGVRQVFRIGKNWKGLLDVAGFINQYDNMIEYAFGIFDTETYARLNPNPDDPNDPDLIRFNQLISQGMAQGLTASQVVAQMVGFQATNAEKARITGVEFSFSSEGKIGDVELRTLMGYTYMNPISLNNDPEYRKTFSDTTSTLLKYRFNHLVKGDVEAIYKGVSLGISCRYNSFMRNIDAIFEEDLIGDGTYILPGLKEYRERNNKGFAVWDIRVGYKFAKHYSVAFMVNNFLNTEYMTRPGDIQAPRHYMLQFMFKL